MVHITEGQIATPDALSVIVGMVALLILLILGSLGGLSGLI
jgi:hypothetical protein